MKKFIFSIILAALSPLYLWAQSSMTDNQVADFVQKEVARGTSQAQIVTKLMQNGVDISQIRRVRQKFQRQMNDTGLGAAGTDKQAYSRMRTGHTQADDNKRRMQADELQRATTTSQRIQSVTDWQPSYDEDS